MALRRLALPGAFSSYLLESPAWLGLSFGLVRCSATAAVAAEVPKASVETIEVTVDGNSVTIPKGYSVLQACDAAGLDIPR